MHPFSKARERNRALNAVKMERMFAKPFLASLEGHVDSVGVLARKPGTLNIVASGSGDGGMFSSLVFLNTHLNFLLRNYFT